MSIEICSDLSELHPYVEKRARRFLAEANGSGMGVAAFETIRKPVRQKYLKATGNSKLAFGWHCVGCALDVWPVKANGKWPRWDVVYNWGHWDALARLGQSWGFRWGGRWKIGDYYDRPHFQLTFGLKRAIMKKAYREDGLCATNAIIDKLLKSKGFA